MAISDWRRYISTLVLLPPRPHVVDAHLFLGDNGRNKVAVDIACGTGRDTLYLLEKGYQVYAFDKDIGSLKHLSTHPLACSNPSLDLQLSLFEEYPFPKANMINASACLFFCKPNEFSILWHNIDAALDVNGIFCGHFLGTNNTDVDTHTDQQILTHSHEDIETLLKKYYIISWKVKKEYSAQLTNKKQRWLVNTLIAMKK
ncbi:class I SAM-dependent methyltransferase [Photobacterium frigidiphilum]|uniref:class I SAM-dependent methyltransferase n=1 Tax=Photobacterium frigidiphilum TaxID=264736 RepID=UPI003D130B2C